MNEPPPGEMGGAPVQAPGGGKAVASLVLGIIGLVAWFIPLFGLPITIVGFVLGLISMHSPRRGMAVAGVVLCVIGLVFSVANAAIGAYLGATGQLRILQ
jgi:membrane-bound ClpP family serine protease